MGIKEGWIVAGPGKEVSTPEDIAAVDGRMQGRSEDNRLVIGVDTDSVMSQCTAATYAKHVHGVIPLRTFFYKLKRYMPLDVDIVCVFDGKGGPAIKNGRKVRKTTEPSWYGSCKTLIKKLGYHIHMAPGEGEAELAALNENGLIDFVLTSDSDVFPFGAKNVLRSTTAERDELTVYRSDLIEMHQELNKAGLILYSILAGGDYTKGVLGCGQKTALALAQCGFGDALYDACIRYEKTPHLLQSFISSWLPLLQAELRTNSQNRMNEKEPALAARLSEVSFPPAQIVLLYACPLTSFSEGKKPDFQNRWKARGIEIPDLAAFFMEHFGWRTIHQLQDAFDGNIWEGMFRQMLYSPESLYDPVGHVLITDEYWIKLTSIKEKSRRTQRKSLIDSWYRIRVSTEPLVNALNEAYKDLKDEDDCETGSMAAVSSQSPSHGVNGSSYHDDAAAAMLPSEPSPPTQIIIWVPEMYCPDSLAPFSKTNNSSACSSSLPAGRSLLTLLNHEAPKAKTKRPMAMKTTAPQTPAPFPCPSPLEIDSGSEYGAGPSRLRASSSYEPPSMSELLADFEQVRKRRRLTSSGKQPVVIDLTEDD